MKNLTKKIPYKKPLVIGMGGGNDIVSASLILSYLKEQGVSDSIITQLQVSYNVGLAAKWYNALLTAPLSTLIVVTGWVVYRFRETRALTLARRLVTAWAADTSAVARCALAVERSPAAKALLAAAAAAKASGCSART